MQILEQNTQKLMEYEMGEITVENSTRSTFIVEAIYFHIARYEPDFFINDKEGFCVLKNEKTEEMKEISNLELLQQYTKLKDLPLKDRVLYKLTGKLA